MHEHTKIECKGMTTGGRGARRLSPDTRRAKGEAIGRTSSTNNATREELVLSIGPAKDLRYDKAMPNPKRHRMTPRPLCTLMVLAMLCTLTGCITDNETDAKPNSRKETSSKTLLREVKKGPVHFTAEITPKAPRLSDLIRLKLRIESDAEVETFPPAFGQAVSGFTILDYQEKNPVTQDGKTIRTFIYKLEPPHSGKHLIRALEVSFIDRRKKSESKDKKVKIALEPIEIEVSSEFEGKAPDLAALKEMDDPVRLPGEGLSATSWGLIAAGIALLGGGAIWWALRSKPAEGPREPQRSPEEIAYAELEHLKGSGLAEKGLFADFYVELTGIVRRYIERTTGIDAPDQTTEEFLAAMRGDHRFDQEKARQLEAFLAASDLVKYAAMQPEVKDLEESFSLAAAFVTQESGVGLLATASA